MATKLENEAADENAYKALEDAVAIDFPDDGGKGEAQSGRSPDEARASL